MSEQKSLNTKDFVTCMMINNTPEDCLSMATSLLVSTVARLKGNDKAAIFLNQLNNLMAETFGEISVEYKHPKSKTKVVQTMKKEANNERQST